jgi:hypothetical protein
MDSMKSAACCGDDQPAAVEVLRSRVRWNGMWLWQYDFLMSGDASLSEVGPLNVRVLVSVRRGCSPNVKWIIAGSRGLGWGRAAYQWLVREFGSPLKVTDVCGEASVGFHRRMKSLGLVSSFNIVRPRNAAYG